MTIVDINGKAVSLGYPKGFEFKEVRPFNRHYPRKIKLYEIARGKQTYYLPRVYILPEYGKNNIPLPDFLMPKQKIAVEKLLEYNYGIMLSGVGSGKSFMIAAMAKIYSGNTLVIAPKVEIANGLKEKFDKLGIECEIFDLKRFNIYTPPKILIMVQRSVDMYWDSLLLDKIYKQVLIDEIHANFTINRIHFFIHYQYEKIYGFTGTPELNHFSPEPLFKLFNNVYVNSGIRPKNPEIYAFNYKPPFKYLADDWAELVDCMYWNIDRMSMFIAMVVEVMKREDRHMGIIFVERKDVAEALAFAISECGVPAMAYTGKLTSKKRQEVLQYLTKVKGVMVATYQTVGTGFDHPPLDTAFYFMFVKFKAQVKQAVGRILRGSENPEYYDFQDSNLWEQISSRMQAYKEMRPDSSIYKYDYKNLEIYIKCKLLEEEILKYKKELGKDY